MSEALDTLNEIMKHGHDGGRVVSCWVSQMELAIDYVKELEASLAAAQRERKPETTQPDAEEGWAKRIRHAAGEFNNDSKSPMSVIREMASRIRQLEGLVDDLRREANLEEPTP